MNFYNFSDISAAGNCVEIAELLYSAKISHGRCAATWRGGDNYDAVAISKESWFDHVDKRGGGVIQLAAFKFNGDIQRAQEFLGDHYHLAPKQRTVPGPKRQSRYDELIASGYIETRRDVYTDATGAPQYFEVRLDHSTYPAANKKQYLLGHGNHWGLGDIPHILFNLPAIVESPWVCIVEGPKNAQCLIDLGVPATTCVGGAKKWADSYSAILAGKDIAILPDNDEPGRQHAEQVAASLHAAGARSIKVVITSSAPKGDVFDYIHKEGHSIDDVISLISVARKWSLPVVLGNAPVSHDIPAETLADAKQANTLGFSNAVQEEHEVIKRGKPTREVTNVPRIHEDLLRDLSRRFLGFPRRVGDSYLFDHDRDSGDIVEIEHSESLIAWIGRKSRRPVLWAKGDAFISMRQFFESVKVQAIRYESISQTPDWPIRQDVYYSHGPLPPSDPNYSRLEGFLDFFLPAKEHDRCLIRAFVCAPLWFRPGVSRPSWIIDSRDGQNSGKTKIAEFTAALYGHAPIKTSKQELTTNFQQLVKRCVSKAGRNARVFLVDNVEGDFSSPELADLITSKDITGMAPYGHGEETRPNNLVYAITANSATVSTDIADRSYYIHVVREIDSEKRRTWESRIQEYISLHRLEIFADIIAMLSRHAHFITPTRTRTSAFEASILQPCCLSEDAYVATVDYMLSSRSDSNSEEDQARTIAEVFSYELTQLGIGPTDPAFIRSEVVNSWGRRAIMDSAKDFRHAPIQLIRNFAKIGTLPQVDKTLKRWQSDGGKVRHSGIGWNIACDDATATLVFRDADGSVKTSSVTRVVPKWSGYETSQTRLTSAECPTPF